MEKERTIYKAAILGPLAKKQRQGGETQNFHNKDAQQGRAAKADFSHLADDQRGAFFDGAPWGTRRDVVEGLANLESVETFVDGEAKRVEARTLRFGEEPINDPQPETRYLRGSLEHHDPLPVYVHPFYSKDLCGEEWEDIISREEEEGWSSIYTDGSRREGKTGAGVHQGSKDTSVYLGRQCTVNDGELIAVGEALEREGELLVITDSRVTIAKLQRIARGDLTPEGPARLVRRRWEERINRGNMTWR
ncbi:hypothetical protein BDZ91DRAFT_794339 [Kalaharituber pfeilii]|nr:hypothetical protein BDZ91DRAFT_794339 [Kalaharituber pfeilii]